MSEKRLFYTIADQILELIDSGLYPPWSRLPGEKDLAIKFGVSRDTVRAAEVYLQAQRRIEIRVGSGAFVLDRSRFGLQDLPKVCPLELVEAYALFASEAAAVAATIITSESIMRLELLVSKITGQATLDIDEKKISGEEAYISLHSVIASSTKNVAIIFVIENLRKMWELSEQRQRLYRAVRDSDFSQCVIEYMAIIEAFKNQDSFAARSKIKSHFTRVIAALLLETEKESYREVGRNIDENRLRYTLIERIF